MSGSHTHAGISFTRGCPTCERRRKQVGCNPAGEVDTPPVSPTTGSGEAKLDYVRCCFDTPRRYRIHGNVAVCANCGREAKLPTSSTVTLLEDAVKTAQRFHSERLWHDGDVRELARIVALIGTELLALRYGNE